MKSEKKDLDIIAKLRQELKYKDDQIRRLKSENEALRSDFSKSGIDSLTGLLNRQSFNEKYKSIIDDQSVTKRLSLILIDFPI